MLPLRTLLVASFVTFSLAQSGCFDAVVTCAKLAQLGYCKTNVLVRQKCGVSCNTCPTPSPTAAQVTSVPKPTSSGLCNPDPKKAQCCDTVVTCDRFKKAGACAAGTKAIRTICQNTCGFCDEEKKCAKSQFDCYNIQMECAEELRKSVPPIPLTADNLIKCVLPKAQAIGQSNPEHCCVKWVDFTQDCTVAKSVDCKCKTYDVFHDVPLGTFKKECDSVTQAPTGITKDQFQVRLSQWATSKACASHDQAKGFRGSMLYNWRVGCNRDEVNAGGSIRVACGKLPGTVTKQEFRDTPNCTQGPLGGIPPIVTIQDGECTKKRKTFQRASFTAPAECGTEPTPSPVAAPSIHFSSIKGWKKYCRENYSKTNADCKSCGGKLRTTKKGHQNCKVPGKAEKKMRCSLLNADVCLSVGCEVNRRGNCSGAKGKGKHVNPPWL